MHVGEFKSIDKKMARTCSKYRMIKGESAFNQLKRNKGRDVGFTKQYRECTLETYENKEKLQS